MKSASDYLKNWDAFGISDIEYLIEQVQKETYLQALKDTELRMGILSDNTVFTQGYRNLQERIKKLEDEINNNNI